MPIQYSYTHAAQRLLADALALWAHGTPETASHLAGLSAECAMKSILVGLGLVAVTADGQLEIPRLAPVNRPWRVHIDKLWSEFQSRLTGPAGAVYVGLLPTGVPAPYDGWSVDHRYVASAQLAAVDLERWMWAAIALRWVLHEAASRGEVQ
jgi:hypothetical protein